LKKIYDFAAISIDLSLPQSQTGALKPVHKILHEAPKINSAVAQSPFIDWGEDV